MPIYRSEMRSPAAHLAGVGHVAELEARLCSFYQVEHALAVSSATLGLLGLGLALDLTSAEFITTPYTYGGTLAGWLLLGARPRFADIDPHTLTLHPAAVRKAINSRTRAILSVDIFGNPADSSALHGIAAGAGLIYVSDAAQSFGASRARRPASCAADAFVVSFTSGKPLSAGEGGAVLTNSRRIYDKLLWHTQHPLRQRRELGLAMANEFALNARIHPAAARRALADFDRSLDRLRLHQHRCDRIVDRINADRWAEPIRFRDMDIEPAYWRLTAAAMPGRQPPSGWKCEPAPVSLLYRQRAFAAQFRPLLAASPDCPRAEDQASRRVVATPPARLI